MALDLFIVESASDPTQALVAGFLTSQLAPPVVLAQGDKAKAVNLHFLTANPDSTALRPYVYNTPPATVSLAVGAIDALPAGGSFTFTDATQVATLAYNVTAALRRG